jgi:hypothetical protein
MLAHGCIKMVELGSVTIMTSDQLQKIFLDIYACLYITLTGLLLALGGLIAAIMVGYAIAYFFKGLRFGSIWLVHKINSPR